MPYPDPVEMLTLTGYTSVEVRYHVWYCPSCARRLALFERPFWGSRQVSYAMACSTCGLYGSRSCELSGYRYLPGTSDEDCARLYAPDAESLRSATFRLVIEEIAARYNHPFFRQMVEEYQEERAR